VIIPFSLIALKDRRYLGAFRPLAVAGHVSLFPLLFTAAEFPVKTVYTIFWLVLFLLVFDRLVPAYVDTSATSKPANLRQISPSASMAPRSILFGLYRTLHPSNSILLARTWHRFWQKIRILAIDVHQFLFGHWSNGKLGGILQGLLRLEALLLSVYGLINIILHRSGPIAFDSTNLKQCSPCSALTVAKLGYEVQYA
jgi:hypothetical protein